nr:MAG TPA: hypothetical protein [Caudoviricetes sp.]
MHTTLPQYCHTLYIYRYFQYILSPFLQFLLTVLP